MSEIRGDVWRGVEMSEIRGDVGRCGEMWGDVGRCGESGESGYAVCSLPSSRAEDGPPACPPAAAKVRGKFRAAASEGCPTAATKAAAPTASSAAASIPSPLCSRRKSFSAYSDAPTARVTQGACQPPPGRAVWCVGGGRGVVLALDRPLGVGRLARDARARLRRHSSQLWQLCAAARRLCPRHRRRLGERRRASRQAATRYQRARASRSATSRTPPAESASSERSPSANVSHMSERAQVVPQTGHGSASPASRAQSACTACPHGGVRKFSPEKRERQQ